MQLGKAKTLRGVNLWAGVPVLEARVVFEADDAACRLHWSYAISQLRKTLPAAINGHTPDCFDSLQCASLAARVALHLQQVCGANVTYADAVPTKTPTEQRLLVQFQDEALGHRCVNLACDLVAALLRGESIDLANRVAELREAVPQLTVSVAVRELLSAAARRGIPSQRLGASELFQLGHGFHQRRITAGETDRTGAIAQSIAGDDDLARELISGCGIPVAADQPTTLQALVIGDRVVAAVFQRSATSNGSATTGLHEVTELLIEGLAAQLVAAARVIGLDVANVAANVVDIALTLEAQGGGIVSVGSATAFPLEVCQSKHRAADAIIESLFPAGKTGRIPLVGVTGVNGKTTTTRLIAHLLTTSGKQVGMTCTEGIYIAGRRIDRDDCSGPQSAKAVLMNPQIDAAVLETARGGILREGLGFDHCDVAVVMNIAEGDHLGLAEIDTPAELAQVKQVLVRGVAPTGAAVLKADDPLVAAMAPNCPGSVIFFSRNADDAVIAAHRQRGGRAVFVRGGSICAAEGSQEFALLSLERVPLTHAGKIGFQIENSLAATAAAWSLGVPAELIRIGLETFSAGIDKLPGRFNLMEIAGATVVFDYGHNPSSLQALLEALEQLKHARRIAIFSAAGDRRDCDMVRQGELLGHAFDRVIIYEDKYLRGRQPGEISALFRQGLERAPRVQEICEIPGWIAALEAGLVGVQAGDLLLVQADTIDQTVQFVRDYFESHGQCREIQLTETSREIFHSTAVRELAATGNGVWTS